MLSESESLSKLSSDLSIKAVSCKIDTNNGYVSEGCNLESTSASSAAEVTDNMMTLWSSEVDESFNVMLPRRYLAVGIVLPNGVVLLCLRKHQQPFFLSFAFSFLDSLRSCFLVLSFFIFRPVSCRRPFSSLCKP